MVKEVEKKVIIKKCKTLEQRDRVCLKFQFENYSVCDQCEGKSELIVKKSNNSKFKKTIYKYCPKCRKNWWICPFCGEKKTRHDHLSHCKSGPIWNKDENGIPIKVYKCCDFTFQTENQIYDHIILNHCNHLKVVDHYPRSLTEEEV